MAKWAGQLSTTEPFNNLGLIKVRQNNKGSETLEFQLTENNQVIDLTGMDLYFNTKFNRFNPVQQRATIVDAKKGIIRYTLNDYDMQLSNPFQPAYFEFRVGDKYVGSTQTFFYHIVKSIYQECTDGSTYIIRLEELFKIFQDFFNTQSQDWLEFVEANREILESIDPGGMILTELIDARHSSLTDIKHKRLNERLYALDDEFKDNYINVKWFGAVGDGVTDDTAAINKALDFCNNNFQNFISGEYQKYILFFPSGQYIYNGTMQLRSNISLVGVGSRRWGKINKGMCSTLVFDITESDEQAIRASGWDDSDNTLIGFKFEQIKSGEHKWRVDDIHISNLNIENVNGKTGKGVGINFLNTILSHIEDVSINGFETGIIQFNGWGNSIRRCFLTGNKWFGIVVHGVNNGGTVLENNSVNGRLEYENFKDVYGLDGHNEHAESPCGIYIENNIGGIAINNCVVENYARLTRVYNSKGVVINSYTTEECTISALDVTFNSTVTLNGGYNWNRADRRAYNFTLDNNSKLIVNDFNMIEWYQFPFKIDDTSTIIADNVNIRPNEPALGKNIVINKSSDNIVKSTGITILSGNKSVSHTKVNDKFLSQNYNAMFDFEANNFNWDDIAKEDIIYINKKGASSLIGKLSFTITGPKNPDEKIKAIQGIVIFANGDRLSLIDTSNSGQTINTEILSKYNKLRIFGSVLIDTSYDR